MDLATAPIDDVLQWLADRPRTALTAAVALEAVQAGTTDTALIERYSHLHRTWPEGVPIDDWHLTLAEVYRSTIPCGSLYAHEWADLAATVGFEVARLFLVDDDSMPAESFQVAHLFHRRMIEAGLDFNVAQALYRRSIPAGEWPLWVGIDVSLASQPVTAEEAHTLTALGWHGSLVSFTDRADSGYIRVDDAPRTLAAARAGFTREGDLRRYRDEQSKRRSGLTRDEVDAMIATRTAGVLVSHLKHYRMIGATRPSGVLALVERGVTPAIAKAIDASIPKPAYGGRREPLDRWQVETAIREHLETP